MSRAQSIARSIGIALVFIHSLIAFAIANNFGNEGMEWWPVIFLPLDFPVSVVVILIEKYFDLFSEWGLWFTFVVTGTIWHYYWPQGITWLVSHFVSRFKRQ